MPKKDGNEIVILGGIRTAFGRFGGSLKEFDCYDMGAVVMAQAIRHAGIDAAHVDEVFWGNGDTSSCKDVYTPVVARQSLLKAGLRPETVSTTIDKACVSGTSAVLLASRALRLGEARIALAGGSTTFSQEPLILRHLRWEGHRMGSVNLEDPLFELGYKDYNPVARDAGEIAVQHGISREEQDEWAVRSHQAYGSAFDAGKFTEEIFPLTIRSKDGSERSFAKDEQYRADVTIEKLSRLKTIYGSPTVTAGNAPGLNDGAAALLLTTRELAAELGIEPLAQVVGGTSVATKPQLLAESPAMAIAAALEQNELSLADLKLIEINEAFAAVPLVSTKILAETGGCRLQDLRDKLNVNGGAIAIGHANTASGARLLLTLAYELKRQGGGYGVAAICGGLAQGDAVILKVD